MSKLQWDNAGQRFYHNGISKVILFPTWDATNKRYTGGVAWNGVTSVEESPDGGDANDLWADNIKYGSIRTTENLKGSISAYQWPDMLNELDGKIETSSGIILGQQKRNKRFGLCYRTEIGSDTNPNAGYKLHFLYDVMLSPSDKSYETVNDSPDAVEFSWDFECLPQKQTYTMQDGYKPLYPGEPFLYEGPEGYAGYAYTQVGKNDEDKSPIKYSEGSTYAVRGMVPNKKNSNEQYDGTSLNTGAYLCITPSITGNFSVQPFAYGHSYPIVESDPLISATYVIAMFDVRYSIQPPTNNRYYPLDVSITRDSGFNVVNPEQVGWTITFGRNTPDPSVWNENASIVIPNMVTKSYAYSSVILDSRSTSAEKMTAISNMIYNGTNDMPTLSDLFS